MTDVKLPFGRCLCIHSHLQFVDVALQSLLLHHGVLPVPLETITETPSSSLQKTIKGIDAVRTELKEVFRSARRRNVQAVRVHIGSTPHRPSYIYELPVSICDADNSTMSDCGTCCQELTNAEKRTINRHFFTRFPVLGEKAKPHDRAFLFIQMTSNVISENLEETELDVESLDSKTKRIHLEHEGCQQQSENRSGGSKKKVWIRIVPFIVSSKD